MNAKPRMAVLSLAEYKETLERLKRLEALCTRAADALTYTRSCWGWLKETPAFDELIAELRKAAE